MQGEECDCFIRCCHGICFNVEICSAKHLGSTMRNEYLESISPAILGSCSNLIIRSNEMAFFQVG